jgi:DNA-binding LacI/PurR family transcriptional regulator
LKTRLGVGRDTLRSALKLLASEGWISASGKGYQRRIEPGRITSQMSALSRRLPVTFLSPHPVEHRVTLLEMADTESRLIEQGLNLRFVSPEIFQLKNPDRQLEQLIETHPSSAWILFISSEAIQRWFSQRGIPTFLYELPFPGVDLPYVASDWEGAAFHAGIQLLRQGHRTIGIFEYKERRPGLLAIESGLRRAIASSGMEGRLVAFKDDHSPASVARSLDAAFSRREKPTALVLSRAAQLLTCYSWLASQGIRVPADVSVISLANDSWFKDLHPAICHYQPASALMSRNIADRVLELVTTGQITRKSLRVELEYIPGDTIGPGKRG